MTTLSAPGGTVAVCAAVGTHRVTMPDFTIAMVLFGMLRYPAVLRAVKRLGEDLFPPGPYRVLAAALVTGCAPDTRWLTGPEKAVLHATLDQLARMDIPDTEAWAMSVVTYQAERRHVPMLAASLRWAAKRAEDGHRLDDLRRHTMHVFDIAEGTAPLDPANPWGVTP